MLHTVAKKQKRNSPKQHVTLVGHGHEIQVSLTSFVPRLTWLRLAVDAGKHLVDYIPPPGYNGHLLLMRVSCSYTEFNF